MHNDFWWLKVRRSDPFFNPQDDVVAGSVGVVTEIMVKAEMSYSFRFQQTNDFVRPATAMPAIWRWPLVIEINLQLFPPSKRKFGPATLVLQ